MRKINTMYIIIKYIYCILRGQIKGFNRSITTIMCEDGSYRTVVLLTHFNKETCLFIQKMS